MKLSSIVAVALLLWAYSAVPASTADSVDVRRLRSTNACPDCNLSGADLSGANLQRANLRNADLRNANLSGADLRGANLRRANLSNADLRNADLRGADLRNATQIVRTAQISGGRQP
jgi:uncharacterized protein YjbI with pentapeptide repeats